MYVSDLHAKAEYRKYMDGEVLGGEGQKELAEMALETGRLPMRLDAADFADAERRKSILKDMLGGMGEHVHIDIDFRCEYGKNGVTSAGSVVTRSVPADCVAVGNPCRVIKNSDGGASVGSGLSDLPSPVPTGPHAVSSVPDGIGPKSATCLIIRHRCQKIRHAKNRRIGVSRLFLICCICGMLFIP